MFANKYDDKEVYQWRQERHEALCRLDIKYFKPFYGKWVARGIYPSMMDDKALERYMYEQAAVDESLPTSRREEAKDWLRLEEKKARGMA